MEVYEYAAHNKNGERLFGRAGEDWELYIVNNKIEILLDRVVNPDEDEEYTRCYEKEIIEMFEIIDILRS